MTEMTEMTEFCANESSLFTAQKLTSVVVIFEVISSQQSAIIQYYSGV